MSQQSDDSVVFQNLSCIKKSKSAVGLPFRKQMPRRASLSDVSALVPAPADLLAGIRQNTPPVPKSLPLASVPGSNFVNIQRYGKAHCKVCIFLLSYLHNCLFFRHFNHCCQKIIFFFSSLEESDQNNGFGSVVFNERGTLWGASENLIKLVSGRNQQ